MRRRTRPVANSIWNRTELTNPDFMKLGDAFGFHTVRVDDLRQLAPAVANALKKDRATLIEVPVEFKPYR